MAWRHHRGGPIYRPPSPVIRNPYLQQAFGSFLWILEFFEAFRRIIRAIAARGGYSPCHCCFLMASGGPCTGKFTVVLWRPRRPDLFGMPLKQFYDDFDQIEIDEVKYQGFPASGPNENNEYDDIRDRSGKPLKILRKCLRIEVPKKDPLHQTQLTLMEGNGKSSPVTTNFARPSPVPKDAGGGDEPLECFVVQA